MIPEDLRALSLEAELPCPTAVEKGRRTLRDGALAKAREGVTSLAEVLRVVPYRILQGG